MRFLFSVLAVVVALSSAVASAEVVSFPADNFSLDVPEGWVPVAAPRLPPHCRMITAARSPSNGSYYDVITMDLPLHGSPEEFLMGMRKPLIAKGWKASPIRDEMIDGRPFAVFTMSRDIGPPFMLTATTFAGDRVYAVQAGTTEGDVEDVAELKAVVQSFRFLKAVHSVSRREATTGSQAYQIGYSIGHHSLVGLGVLLGLGLVSFLVVRAARSGS